MPARELLKQATSHYDAQSVQLLERAVDFATKKHEGQTRKSGEPYIIHPLAVATILVDWGMDTDTVVAGVLHDTVEDTDATLREIENLFGRDVTGARWSRP